MIWIRMVVGAFVLSGTFLLGEIHGLHMVDATLDHADAALIESEAIVAEAQKALRNCRPPLETGRQRFPQ